MIRRAPKLESLFVATFVLFGVRLGVRPIGDNSMFTHLRTGIDMVHGGGIPGRDPYSWSAKGAEWVVQSWLPEWTYGWAERLGGFRLVVLEQALLMAGLAWLLLRLARAGSPVRTGMAGLLVVGISTSSWSPRPLLFGLICMALTVTIVERRRTTWLLVPVVWLWVQSHGSFPLGLAWLVARAMGEALDWRSWPRDAMSYIGAFLAGLVVAVINPVGIRLLTFPFTLGDKREAFQNIIEWRSPDFQRGGNRITLVFLVLILLLFARARLTWRDAVPIIGFLALSLIAMRNLPVAAIVFAPVLGRALRRPESAPTRPVAATQDRMNRVLAVTFALVFVLFASSIWSGSGLRFRSYPEAAAAYIDEQGLFEEPHRVAHMDFVGNYLELRYGRRVPVFVDDRYDMYPLDVARDYQGLLAGKVEPLEILDRRKIDVVLWDKDQPLTHLLAVSARWEQVFAEGEWVVFRRII